MKQSITPVLFAALMLAGTQAFADDTMQPDTMTSQHKQMMKECMAKQQAKDSSMSKDAMHSACMAEMKTKMNDGAMNPDPMSKGTMDSGKPAGTPPKP